MPKISIISTTFNRSTQMRRGISSILNQDNLPADLEIVLLNDGSTDDTEDIVKSVLIPLAKEKGITLKYIPLNHPEHRISSIPKNIGIRNSTGEIIIFSESELLHIDDTIAQLVKRLEANSSCTPVVTQLWTMGKRIYEKLDEESFTHPRRILSHPYAMLVSGDMQNTKAPDSDFGITGSINCFTGALFATTRKILEEVQGFDELMKGHGWEDWDLLHRLGKAGKAILYCNDIAAIHMWHEKNYPYNTDTTAKENGKISETREGYKANLGKKWGSL